VANIPLPSNKSLRSVTINGQEYPIYFLGEALQAPVDPTGGATHYLIDDAPAVALDAPTAASRYCQIRIYHQAQDQTKKLFYRSDGTSPAPDGSNAFGFLLHGDATLVKQATLTSFVLCGETACGPFDVWAEFFNLE
jgi:hypothetical protein